MKSGELDELTITTNGSQLTKFADDLYAAGVRRINVSVDTLNPEKFAEITRWGRLPQVLDGIEAAKAAGLKVKINAVALKDENEAEIPSMIEWAHGNGHDLTLIETMPMGDIDGDRTDQYLPLSKVRADLEKTWTLTDLPERTGGPARYVRIEETGGKARLHYAPLPTISAKAAIACVSPAQASSICASARTTMRTCVRR